LPTPKHHTLLKCDENHTNLASPVLLDFSNAYQAVLTLCFNAIKQKSDYAKIFCVSQTYLKKRAKLGYLMVSTFNANPLIKE
jgi:hypothetical protein